MESGCRFATACWLSRCSPTESANCSVIGLGPSSFLRKMAVRAKRYPSEVRENAVAKESQSVGRGKGVSVSRSSSVRYLCGPTPFGSFGCGVGNRGQFTLGVRAAQLMGGIG